MKEVYTYNAPFLVYGLDWSTNKGNPFSLVMGSFIEVGTNKLQVLELDAVRDQMKLVGEIEQTFPSSKIKWTPSSTVSRLPFAVR